MSWSERARARESQVEGERDAALRFISRRHAHSESEEVLASRRFPVPTPRVARPARPVPTPVGWPVGTPPRPIRLQQLWSRDGTGGEHRAWMPNSPWLVMYLDVPSLRRVRILQSACVPKALPVNSSQDYSYVRFRHSRDRAKLVCFGYIHNCPSFCIVDIK